MKWIILLYFIVGMTYSSFVMVAHPVAGFFMLPVTTAFWPAFLIADMRQPHQP